MKVLITGGAGFIGSNLAEKCVEIGWDVSIVDNLTNGNLYFIKDLHNKLREFTVGDFASESTLHKVRSGAYDVIFHLAANPRVLYSCKYPLRSHEENVEKTLKLIEASKGSVKRFIFASSSSVYGDAIELPTTETCNKSFNSPYALQKSIVEDYLKLWSDLYGLESACMRFFNVYGKNQLGSSPYSTAIAAWLTSIYNGETIRSDGDGNQKRDLIHVSDVVEALLATATHKGHLPVAEVFNVGSGKSISNNEILELLFEHYPYVKNNVHSAPRREGDVDHTLASIEKARRVLDWYPKVEISEGIKDVSVWFDENWTVLKGLNQDV